MSAQHTPGPWEVKYWYQKETDTRGWNISADGYLLPMNGYETDYDEEAEANARLIAAAPELLDAVRFLLPIVQSIGEPDDNDEPGLIAARAAVAKATGRKS